MGGSTGSIQRSSKFGSGQNLLGVGGGGGSRDRKASTAFLTEYDSLAAPQLFGAALNFEKSIQIEERRRFFQKRFFAKL